MLSPRFAEPREGPTAELYRRISPVGDWNISIVPILNQWVEEGRSVDAEGLKDIIRELRYYKRYNHALEISMWMSDKRYFELSSLDAAVRLELISKAQGIEQNAEKYFNDLSVKRKGLHVYSALLKCYATEKCVEKAEAVMQKMRDLGYDKNARDYNFMLNLYYKTGNMEKMESLLQEMEENGIVHDKFTLAILFSAYAAIMDIEKMDKIVRIVESEPNAVFDWTNYNAAAVGYKKAGLFDKAFEMLKKAEARLPSKPDFTAYHSLLTQYATIGRKDEVVRVWSLYKRYKVYNPGYKRVLKSLVMLGDIEMAEGIFDEWESQDLSYDMNVPNVMIGAYSKKGLIEKAEALVDRAISKGGKPNGWTWYCLATGYLENDQPRKGVEMMKRAIVLCVPYRKPSIEPLAACLEHLKGLGDIEEAEEFIKLLMDESIISLDIQEKLLNAVKAEKSVQTGALLELMKAEKKS
ncbi:pentatricopeptide repeat-containing protein At2g20710, mitochondrial-like isoform X2 [Euphorbia lathyris]